MSAPASATTERIGDLLIREGLITKEQLDQALLEQKQNGTRVGYNLVKLGFVPEVELTKMLAKQYKLPAVDLAKFQVDVKIVKLIPGELAEPAPPQIVGPAVAHVDDIGTGAHQGDHGERGGRRTAGSAELPLNLLVGPFHSLLDTVLQGLKLLELDSVGGSGSRGYGKVKFVGLKIDGTDSQSRLDAIKPFESTGQ